MARRVEVEVVVRVARDGSIRPLSIQWEDGRVYEVDKLLDIRRAASTKCGGAGIRYTVRIRGKQAYLFDDDGHWFMESARE